MTTLTGKLKRWFGEKSSECLGCGDCCRQFSWHLKASDNDQKRWKRLGRHDLLARVNRLGWIWVDPETKQRLPLCPFLVKTSPDKAHCGIHDIKPDICRAYPTLQQNRQCLKGVFLG